MGSNKNEKKVRFYCDTRRWSLWKLRTKLYRKQKFLMFPLIIVFFCLIFLLKNGAGYQSEDHIYLQRSDAHPKRPQEPLSRVSSELLTDATIRLTKKLPISHTFIFNAYYYPKSKTFGDNAVALNTLVDSRNFNIDKTKYRIVGSNETHQKASNAILQTEMNPSCRYAPAVVITNTVENMAILELDSDGTKVEIPFKLARYSSPKPVVICISPLFLSEQWQLFMLNVHIAHRFGAHVHVYVTSVIESFFDLLKEYERQKYITIDYWLRMKFAQTITPFFEPNSNTEFRAGANTDCLLQYKEAAEYIAFFDLNDILFPGTYRNYLKEFNTEFSRQPSASSLYYTRKKHDIVKPTNLSEFSFHKILGSLRSSSSMNQGVLVIKPALHNLSETHENQYDNLENRRSVKHTTIIHIQSSLPKNSSNYVHPLFQAVIGKVRTRDIIEIEKTIWKMQSIPRVKLISSQLPPSDVFLPIITQCYHNIMLSNARDLNSKSCVNAEECLIPSTAEYRCVQSDAEYFSSYHMDPFTFHYSNNSLWLYDVECKK